MSVTRTKWPWPSSVLRAPFPKPGVPRVLAAWSVVLLAGSQPLGAHHSFAMFDTANPITLTGVVTDFQWTNPHAYIELDVRDGVKGTRHWTIELGSPSILMRGGWTFTTLKKGDSITAVVSPLRSGDPGCLLTRITLADGRVLGNGGPAGVGPGTTEPVPRSPQP